MWTTHAIRSDMSSLEYRQSTLTGDRTSTLISISHHHSEDALAEPWPHDHGLPVALTLDHSDGCWAEVLVRSSSRRQSFSDRFPQELASGSVFTVISLSLNNVEAKIRRDRNPFLFFEKERLR